MEGKPDEEILFEVKSKKEVSKLRNGELYFVVNWLHIFILKIIRHFPLKSKVESKCGKYELIARRLITVFHFERNFALRKDRTK